MLRILSLCTYPVQVPRHGGQVRVNAIHQIYRRAGYKVQHLAIYRGDEYPEEPTSPWNIHFSWAFINEMAAVGGRTDLNATDFLLRDQNEMEKITSLINEFAPDVIQIEQPWLWPLVKYFHERKLLFKKCKIIYSSQNVEFQLIASATPPGGRVISADLVALVHALEMDLAKNADLVVAVSDEDAKVFRSVSKAVTIAPNGIWPRGEATGQEYWNKELHGKKMALFVGSAHPPNATGFVEFLGPSLGFLAPDETVVVVGGVCNLLKLNRTFRAAIGLNLARSILVGNQDAGGLSTFLEKAKVILVPIAHGGGTNIKMAEAIYNRKIVICTSKAMRGYEEFLNLPSIIVRDDAEGFKMALTDALRGKFDNLPAMTHTQASQIHKLLWPSTLKDLCSHISRIDQSLTAAY